MKKKLLFIALMVAFISVLVFAAQINGVNWSWGGGDIITASSTDGKPHELTLAITVTNRGYSSCTNWDIQVPESKSVTWNVKQKIGANATIDGVSVVGCK